MIKSLYHKYLSDADFLITEKSYNTEFRQVGESQFAIGNGYIGSRGIYEEKPDGSMPGTFFAGIFDPSAAKVSELVNAPNPFDIRIAASKGEKLDVTTMTVLEHERILDMKKGLLVRHTCYENHAYKKYDYQSIRFHSLDNVHIAVMQVSLEPLDEVTTFTVNSAVDTSVTNHGTVTEGNKRHFHIHEMVKEKEINYLSVKTLAHEVLLAYASAVVVQRGNKKRHIPRRKFDLKVRKGERVYITKYFAFYTSKDVSPSRIRSKTISVLKKAMKSGLPNLLKKNEHAWEERWDVSDISIEGDSHVQSALRFNIYHLLIAAHKDIRDVSVGARTLSSEGYRGHVFWDTELFLLPFFIFTDPAIARNLLEYRFNRLEAAIEIAKSRGYKGAMFPWESADTGFDETPAWAKDFDGTVIPIHTNHKEHHITADIFYGMFFYYTVTGDNDFMLKMGLKMAIETAKFWEGRLEYNKKKGYYEINDVIGPDEFHESINNNSFTNAMAGWNLETAAKLLTTFLRRNPKTVQKLLKETGVTTKECQKWKKLSQMIKMPIDNKKGLLLPFDGYLRLKNHPLPELNDHGMPQFPKGIKIGKLYTTQFIKQADVVMLFYLFPEKYGREFMEFNYRFYVDRTLHKSSLSAPIHAAVAVRLGFLERAYHYLVVSLNCDRKDIYGNTDNGIHAASIGGSWQAVVLGFCGVQSSKGILSIYPKLPSSWRHIKFSIYYHGKLVRCSIAQKETKVVVQGTRIKKLFPIRVYGKQYQIKLNQKYTFKPPSKKEKVQYDMEGLF